MSEVALPRNKLLRALSPDTLQHLRQSLTLAPLKPRRTLQYSRLPIEQVYFVESGLVSVVAPTDHDRQGVEGWLIGCEGFTGIPVVLGVNSSPHRRSVQAEGFAWAMKSADLARAVDEIPELRRVLLRYIHSILVQTTQIAACNARHPLTRRLARWLLMAQDRLETPTLALTQDAISKMLGVRRASVTEAIGRLEASGAIAAARGHITIHDRSELERLCCSCYGVISGEALRDTKPASDAA
jgi:CRP-like cAMP-binding protein